MRNSRKTITVEDIEKYADSLQYNHKPLLIAATENKKYVELAADFNLTVGTVKSRLSRARSYIAKAKADEKSRVGRRLI